MSNTVAVPPDLLTALRKNVRSEIASLLSVADAGLDEACDEIMRAIAARRALAQEADAYPGDAVAFAAGYAIEDAASRIADDHLSVDEAEFYVARIRICEGLLKRIDAEAVMA